jgi:hypothetical protein
MEKNENSIVATIKEKQPIEAKYNAQSAAMFFDTSLVKNEYAKQKQKEIEKRTKKLAEFYAFDSVKK